MLVWQRMLLLLGAGVVSFDDQVGRECSLKGGSALPGDKRFECAATGEIGSPAFPQLQGVVR
jgi:hypothetical protein